MHIPITIKLVFVVCILCVVGAMLYSVVIGLSVNARPGTSPSRLALLAVVLVVSPVLIMIAIQDNRPISRPLILVWAIAGIGSRVGCTLAGVTAVECGDGRFLLARVKPHGGGSP